MELSIIIVTYYSERVIKDCLKSIFDTVKSIKFEVIVVDNDSQDKTLKIIREYFPDVKIDATGENLGFAKGVNRGIRQAQGDVILLMNPDMIVLGQAIRDCYEFVKSRKEVGVVGPQMVYPDYRIQASFGNFPSWITELLQAIFLYKIIPFGRYVPYNTFNKSYFEKTLEVDWISGGFMMMRREVLDKVGGLDEKFFMYVEDVDFCRRIAEAGYENYYYPRARVIHHHMESSKKNYARTIINEANSIVYYFQKYELDLSLLKFFIYLKLYLQIIRYFIKSLFQPKSKEILNDYKKALMNLDI